jgi:hypothetical protein
MSYVTVGFVVPPYSQSVDRPPPEAAGERKEGKCQM